MANDTLDEDDYFEYHKNLGDIDFDFESYFARHKAQELSEEELDEYPARVYALFCSLVYKSHSDPIEIPAWAAEYVADRLFSGLMGVPWNEEMKLPWDNEAESPLNPRGQRAMSIYVDIENRKTSEPSAKTTDLIAWQAGENNVSFETARADYYAMKKAIEKKDMPERFLKHNSVF